MAIKLSQLQIFAAVADHGSFSAAAAELGCTQSRISHAIAELERELAVRLLERSHAGSKPTDAGHQVLEKARQMLRLEQGLRDSVRTSKELAGRVRVACFRSVGTHLLPYAAEALAGAHPGIVLDIDDGCIDRTAVLDALRQGRADLAIAQLPVEDAFATLPFVQDDYVLVAPAARRLDARFSWDQLDGLPLLQLACPGADEVLEHCRAAGLVDQAVQPGQPGRRLANDTSIAAMVARGMGYSIMPRLAVFPEPEGVRTHALPLPVPGSATRSLVLAGEPAAMRRPEVRAVVEILRSRRMLERTRAWQAGAVKPAPPAPSHR
jgi:DNA-binding transcriptional LysR family regulator